MSPKITSAEVEAADPLKTIEQWAAEKKSDPAMFAVAKATTSRLGHRPRVHREDVRRRARARGQPFHPLTGAT